MTEHRSRQALRPSVGAMVSLNITDEVTRLKAKPEWSSEDRMAVSLVKDDALNILLMVLKEGTRLAEHHTKGPIAVQVLTGSVRFSAGREQTALSAGHIAALDRNVVHSLEALEESVILLTTSIS
jgi:quercetin dioxygenase-like cupin family protein